METGLTPSRAGAGTAAIPHGPVILHGLECGTSDPDGDVEALDSTTGKKVWFAIADENGSSNAAT